MNRIKELLIGCGFVLTGTIVMLWPPGYAFARLERHHRNYLRRFPWLKPARYALARLYADYSRLSQAEMELNVLRQQGGTTDSSTALLAEVHFRRGEYRAALSTAELVKSARRRARLDALIGVSLLHLGDHERATGPLRQAVRYAESAKLSGPGLLVDLATLYEALGVCYARLGDFPSADEALTRAVKRTGLPSERRNNIANAYAHLANGFLKSARFEEAQLALRRALDARPEGPVVSALERTLREIVEERRRLVAENN